MAKSKKDVEATKTHSDDFVFVENQIDLRLKQSVLEDAQERIQRCISRISSDFLDIGKHLNKINETQAYEYLDFKDVYAYAETTFGFKRTATKNFINVYLKFNDKEEALKYNFAQLVELIPFAEEENVFDELPSELSSREIRAVKKIIQIPGQIEPVEFSHQDVIKEFILNFIKKTLNSKPYLKLAIAERYGGNTIDVELRYKKDWYIFRVDYEKLTYCLWNRSNYYSNSDFSKFRGDVKGINFSGLLISFRLYLEQFVKFLEEEDAVIVNDATFETAEEEELRKKEELKQLNKDDPLLFKNKEQRIAFGKYADNYEVVNQFEISGVVFIFFKFCYTDKEIIVITQTYKAKTKTQFFRKIADSDFFQFQPYEFNDFLSGLRETDLPKFKGKTLEDFSPSIYMEEK